mmetsp:Transcript_126947/g.395192  ORF Transcript_126947/g.395192 Transcript_126947/m.395192 type:complete len:203 (-) Transcript_126947:510-1118(-)
MALLFAACILPLRGTGVAGSFRHLHILEDKAVALPNQLQQSTVLPLGEEGRVILLWFPRGPPRRVDRNLRRRTARGGRDRRALAGSPTALEQRLTSRAIVCDSLTRAFANLASPARATAAILLAVYSNDAGTALARNVVPPYGEVSECPDQPQQLHPSQLVGNSERVHGRLKQPLDLDDVSDAGQQGLVHHGVDDEVAAPRQ